MSSKTQQYIKHIHNGFDLNDANAVSMSCDPTQLQEFHKLQHENPPITQD